MNSNLGILVHGDNHFIVRGPMPDGPTARKLVRHWSLIQIGAVTPPELTPWRISSREFRQDLRWVVVVPDQRPHTVAVTQLLEELLLRGVPIQPASDD